MVHRSPTHLTGSDASPHILIVEDEAAIADTLIFALQGEGFTTTWLSLGAAALEYQRQTPADLIILDIALPDICGFETCKQLRRFSEVPVMFSSARDGEIDRVVGLESAPTITWSSRSAPGKWRRVSGQFSSAWHRVRQKSRETTRD